MPAESDCMLIKRLLLAVHIKHGSIVSLFHRHRSQAASMKHLCVSGPATWLKGSDGQAFDPSGQPAEAAGACFVAKASSWDVFIIYLVDPDPNPNAEPTTARHPGYPPPPTNALPMTSQTVHYNQPIVLQCLHTSVVSPVMTIRRVDKGNTIFGGRRPSMGAGVPLGPEARGDPVSQLHKIALEIWEPDASDDFSGSNKSVTFLACKDDAVGMHKLDAEKRWLSGSQVSTPGNLSGQASGAASGSEAGTPFDLEKAASSFASLYPSGEVRSGSLPVPTSPTTTASADQHRWNRKDLRMAERCASRAGSPPRYHCKRSASAMLLESLAGEDSRCLVQWTVSATCSSKRAQRPLRQKASQEMPRHGRSTLVTLTSGASLAQVSPAKLKIFSSATDSSTLQRSPSTLSTSHVSLLAAYSPTRAHRRVARPI